MDNRSKEARSKNMSHIPSKNTKPEETVRKYLFSKGFRYRKNVSSLPGKPDIVLPQIQGGDICQRLLLAWSQGLQVVCPSKNKRGFLGCQI